MLRSNHLRKRALPNWAFCLDSLTLGFSGFRVSALGFRVEIPALCHLLGLPGLRI